MVGAEAEYRPPLASGLFDIAARPETMGKAARSFSEVVGLAGRLRSVARAGGSIEEELERIQNRVDDPVSVRQLTALRYYLDNVISTCATTWLGLASFNTNYRTLISQVDELRRDADDAVLWVTFNYDTLLDIAAAHELGRNLDSLRDLIASDDNLFFKLHGSTSWRRRGEYRGQIEHPGTYNDVIKGAPLLEYTDDFEYAQALANVEGQAWVPAIAVPTVEKVSFECPADHIERLKALLPSVTRALVIGWRGREHHFAALCREGLRTPPETTIVGSDPASAKEIGAYLAQEIPLRIRPSRANGFSDFLRGDRVVSAWQGDVSET